MAGAVNIPTATWWQGEDISFEIAITAGGSPLNMTGYTLEWYLFSNNETEATGAPPTGEPKIKIVDSNITKFNISGTLDGARIAVPDTATIDTTELVANGTYYHELWRIDAGNERLLAYGSAILMPSPRRG